MKVQVYRKFTLSIGIIVTAICSLIYLEDPAPLRELELIYQKAQFTWRGHQKPGDEVVIATIDEKSLDRFGRWPWPRTVFAQLVKKLKELESAVVAFDIVFSSEEQNTGHQNLVDLKGQLTGKKLVQPEGAELIDEMIVQSDHDGMLKKELKGFRGLILGYFFHFDPRSVPHLSPEARQEGFNTVKFSRFRGFLKSSEDLDLGKLNLKSAFAVESNTPAIASATRKQGYFNFDVEMDGTLRRQPLLVRYTDLNGRNYFFPSLAIKAVETYMNATLLFRVGEMGVEQVLINGDESLTVQTNQKGEVSINFLGKRNSFPHISVADILDSNTEELKEKFKGKIVLVGATATAMEDFRRSPFDPVLPGVEIHATVIDNLLQGQTLYEPEWMPQAELIYLALGGVLFTLLFTFVHPSIGLGIGLAFALLQFCAVQWILLHYRIWFFGVLPTLQCFVVLGLVMAQRYIFEENQKRQIRSLFNQYVSSRVIDRLIHHPGGLKLGGEEKELTALFTDLVGFTTFSEKMSAETQVAFLNEFLGEMTEILLKFDGTLDKYDGDAIKAFFGAPLYYSDHALRACTVAIEMQKRLAELRLKWKDENKPQMHMRVGVNTGMMVVGNLGSQQRMNYGMNGDAVNLAARLEGVNKYYKSETIISEATCLQAGDAIETRELDTIKVVGRSTPVKIYELLGYKNSLSPEMEEARALFYEGKASYLKEDWAGAIGKFNDVLSVLPEDGPSRVFIERCEEYMQSPPPENWNGVATMTNK